MRARVHRHVCEGPTVWILAVRPEPALQPRVAIEVPFGLHRSAEPQRRAEASEGLVAPEAESHHGLLSQVRSELAAAVPGRKQLAVRSAGRTLDAEDEAAVPAVVAAKREPKLGIAAQARPSRLVWLPECHEQFLTPLLRSGRPRTAHLTPAQRSCGRESSARTVLSVCALRVAPPA